MLIPVSQSRSIEPYRDDDLVQLNQSLQRRQNSLQSLPHFTQPQNAASFTQRSTIEQRSGSLGVTRHPTGATYDEVVSYIANQVIYGMTMFPEHRGRLVADIQNALSATSAQYINLTSQELRPISGSAQLEARQVASQPPSSGSSGSETGIQQTSSQQTSSQQTSSQQVPPNQLATNLQNQEAMSVDQPNVNQMIGPQQQPHVPLPTNVESSTTINVPSELSEMSQLNLNEVSASLLQQPPAPDLQARLQRPREYGRLDPVPYAPLQTQDEVTYSEEAHGSNRGCVQDTFPASMPQQDTQSFGGFRELTESQDPLSIQSRRERRRKREQGHEEYQDTVHGSTQNLGTISYPDSIRQSHESLEGHSQTQPLSRLLYGRPSISEGEGQEEESEGEVEHNYGAPGDSEGNY